jgi:NurA-like 5'-3' nuclease
MVDEINESVDIVVQLFDDDDDNDDDLQNDHSVCSFDAQNSHFNQKKETEKEILIVRMPAHRLNARPLYAIQKKDIKKIRQLLKEQHRLLLKAYKSNAMYSCSIHEFDEKISTFMTQTNAYSLIEELNGTNPDRVKKRLDTIIEQMKTIFDDLLQHQSMTAMQYEEMKVSRETARLDYLFFLPDTRQVSVVMFLFFFDDRL